jgi:OHCU decarboxylase
MNDVAAFVDRYGEIYENSPWVAEAVAREAAGIESVAEIAKLMAACVDAAPRTRRLALIRAHPELGYRVRDANALTTASEAEQSSAGLDKCTADEFARFRYLNRSYREKFGFPFVMAVRNRSRAEILETFALRLDNDPETEFTTAIDEIHKIARFRLLELGESR